MLHSWKIEVQQPQKKNWRELYSREIPTQEQKSIDFDNEEEVKSNIEQVLKYISQGSKARMQIS